MLFSILVGIVQAHVDCFTVKQFILIENLEVHIQCSNSSTSYYHTSIVAHNFTSLKRDIVAIMATAARY